MKSLEQILETGRPSEIELAKLANVYRTVDPKDKIRDEVLWRIPMLATFSPIYFVAWMTLEEKGAHGLALGVASLATVMLGSLLRKVGRACYAGYRQKHPSEAYQRLQEERRSVFYKVDNNFTYSPTPVDMIYGYRVYPVETLAEVIETVPKGAYAFLGQVYVEVFDRPKKDSDLHIALRRDENFFHYIRSDRNRMLMPPSLSTLRKGDYRSFLLRFTARDPVITAVYPVLDDRVLPRSATVLHLNPKNPRGGAA